MARRCDNQFKAKKKKTYYFGAETYVSCQLDTRTFAVKSRDAKNSENVNKHFRPDF